MKILLAALVLGVVYARPTEHGEDFFGHHLIDVNITDVDNAHYINDLANVKNMGLDIWLYPTLKQTGRLRVPSESVDLFMDLMRKSGVDAKIRHTNLNCKHHLIDVNITDVDHAHYINDLANVGNMGLDIWLYPTLKKTGRLRVPSESVDLFMDLMRKSGVDAKIRHTNLKLLNDETLAMSKSPAQDSSFTKGNVEHDAYYTWSQINDYLATFATYPGVSLSNLTRSTAEGRHMPMISITGGTGSNKKRIFIEAGIHAREWISPASMLYFIDRMLNEKATDIEAASLFNDNDWYIVPVSNPDGYVYTHTTYRYWRKNRRAVPGCGSSRGVDLNSNFNASWGGSGSSGSCRSDTYRGPSVFSEAESMNIRDAISSISSSQGRFDAYLSVHAFSQLLLTPYGYAANTYPDNIDEIKTITNAGRTAILNSDGRTYTVGSAADILYNVDGTSADWARLAADIQYAMTYELRPSSGGLSGFVLPTSQIAPCSKDVWDSIVAMVNVM